MLRVASADRENGKVMSKGTTGAGRFARNAGLAQYPVLVFTLAVMVLLSVTRKNFFTFANIYSIIFGVSVEFFAVVGFTLLLILGEIDLSVGSVFGFIGVFSGFLMLVAGFQVPVALLCSIFCSALIGFINGFLVVRFRINPLMLTLGMMTLIRGVLNAFIGRLGGSTYPVGYRAITRFTVSGVHFTIILMLAVVVLLEALLHRYVGFKRLFFIGQSPESSRLYGVAADRIRMLTYIVCSITAGMAGILAASRSGQTVFNTGLGLEFKMVTAAVLGGASLFGGKGSIFNSFLGLLFLSVLLNGMVMYNINPEWQGVVVGIFLVAAVVVDTRINKEKVE
jgi:ribose/xylose/arabinose/galactoside ABC-type transport system permease subunit